MREGMHWQSKTNPDRAPSAVPLADRLLDHEGTSYASLLNRFPKELVGRYLDKIEREELTEDETVNFLREMLAKRAEATTTTYVSDPELKKLFSERPEILRRIETSVFSDTDNLLGNGVTARVKLLRETLPHSGERDIAVKYILTPTENTLNAAQEHNVNQEVKTLIHIEELEEKNHVRTELIRVPHPYFHHTTEKLQCYGMECVDGLNLHEILDENDIDEAWADIIRTSKICTLPIEELTREIERFWNAVHEYCLHGDVKPRNFMIDKQGALYVIDFGQAVLNIDVSEDGQDQLVNLRDDEIQMTKQAIVQLRKRLGVG